MPYFQTIKINKHIYQIKDAMGVLTTLIIGKEIALLVDTGYGIGDLKTHILTITNLPLIVVNTHGHMDHSCGNYQFEKVYINFLDKDLCIKHNSITWRKQIIENAKNMKVLPLNFDEETYINNNEGNLLNLNNHAIFNLGDLTIETICMEGHTLGSMGFLIKEDRILISSDAACPFVWLFLNESTNVSTYIKMLENVLKLPFDNFLVGHGAGVLLPYERMVEFYKVASTIDIKKAVKVSFNNFDDLNSYCYTTGTMYNQNDTGIIFNPDRL